MKRANLSRGKASVGGFYVIGLALIVSYVLKRHYASASPAELSWILHPTAWLVEAVSGHVFRFESGVGATSVSAGVAITKACAGVNFFIVCWLSLVWLVAMRRHRLKHLASGVLSALVAAYAVTLVVNGFRILMAMHLHREHRTEGTLLYLLALLFTTSLAHRVIEEPPEATPGLRQPRARSGWASLFVPFGIYLCVTLVAPLLNGAASHEAYWQHFSAVASLTALVLLATISLAGIQRDQAAGRIREPGSAPDGDQANDAMPHPGGGAFSG